MENIKTMEKIGIMIRKWDYTDKGKSVNPSVKNLKKQVLTLHNKLKKHDTVYTEYSIENEKHAKRNHIHMILHYNDKDKLYQNLSRFIGNGTWTKRDVGLSVFDECNGRYGLVHTESINDIVKYRNYINKKSQSQTLF